MKLTYDRETDSLYIELSSRPGADAEEVAPDLVVDFDSEGQVVGLDIQHASRHLSLEKIETENLPSPKAA